LLARTVEHDVDADFPENEKIVKACATTKKVPDYELTMYDNV